MVKPKFLPPDENNTQKIAKEVHELKEKALQTFQKKGELAKAPVDFSLSDEQKESLLAAEKNKLAHLAWICI